MFPQGMHFYQGIILTKQLKAMKIYSICFIGLGKRNPRRTLTRLNIHGGSGEYVAAAS